MARPGPQCGARGVAVDADAGDLAERQGEGGQGFHRSSLVGCKMVNMGGSINGGTPKWLVYKEKSH